MPRAAIPILTLALFAGLGRADDPTETRAQALLGILGDVLPEGRGFKVSGILEDGPSANLVNAANPRVTGQLAEGDIVVRIDGKKFKSWRQWYDRLNAAHLAGNGRVRITVRGTDGAETDWIARPAVTDVAVPVEDAPLIAVPDLDDVPDPVFPTVRPLPNQKN